MSFEILKPKLWSVKMTKNMVIRNGKNFIYLDAGDEFYKCYLKKAADGLYVMIDGIEVNLPYDHFDLIKGAKSEN